MAREVPVTRVIRAGFVQTFDALIHQFDGCLHALWAQHLHNLAVDLFHAERRIDGPNMISGCGFRLTLAIGISDQPLQTPFFDQGDGGTEGTQLFQPLHIDAIIVGIADLWRARYHHNLLGMQTVEDLEDALAKGGSPHDGVINDHKVIFVRHQRTIGDVIHMGRQIIPLRTFRNESTQFDILPYHFLDADIMLKLADAVGHAVEGYLGGIGDIGEDGVTNIVADCPHNGRRELFAQPFTFQIDISVRPATEVNALKTASAQFVGRQDLLQTALTTLADDERLARLQLMNILGLQVKGLYPAP